MFFYSALRFRSSRSICAGAVKYYPQSLYIYCPYTETRLLGLVVLNWHAGGLSGEKGVRAVAIGKARVLVDLVVKSWVDRMGQCFGGLSKKGEKAYV